MSTRFRNSFINPFVVENILTKKFKSLTNMWAGEFNISFWNIDLS